MQRWLQVAEVKKSSPPPVVDPYWNKQGPIALTDADWEFVTGKKQETLPEAYHSGEVPSPADQDFEFVEPSLKQAFDQSGVNIVWEPWEASENYPCPDNPDTRA